MKFRILSLIIFIFFQNFAQYNWELLKDKNEVKVYIKDDPNRRQKIVKATTTIKTSLDAIYAVFNDGNYAQHWMSNIVESSELKLMKDKSKYLYLVVNMPFPMKKRDLILHEHFEQNKKTKTFKIFSTSVPDYIPEKQGITRINEAEVLWIFIPKSTNEIEITYQYYIEQNGMPKIEVNNYLSETVMKTLVNLTSEVQKEQFKNQEYKHIKK